MINIWQKKSSRCEAWIRDAAMRQQETRIRQSRWCGLRKSAGVNQDEVLLPDCMEGVLIVRDPEEGDIRIDADANLSTGAITVAEQDEDSIAGKMKDGRDMFIDFGNGVEHPVAINEEQQEKADDTFFYLKQE